ncbi:MAG: M56 family metallopeptidase [Acidobacteriaceae bacterium]|nr:M56 family metallopeptidase [Acidobacteriaceae bacterium]
MSLIEMEALGESFGGAILGIFLRSSVLLITCAFFVLLLRWRTAELKHLLCHGALYGLLLLPVLKYTAPPFRHPSATLHKAELALFPDQPTTVTPKNVSSEVTIITAPIRDTRAFPWMLLATALYISLACVLLLRLLLNLFRVDRLLKRTEPIFDSDLRELSHEIWLQSLSQYRPAIRVSNDVLVPMAVGAEQTTILLPASWTLWTHDKLRAVLVHEMAHVRRNDPQTALLASLTVCLFWLNPLVYWLRRQLAALAEEACDHVTLQDLKPEAYAQILVEFARDLGRKGTRLATASPAAVHCSLMKRRIEHIFSISRHKGGSPLMTRLLLLAGFVPALYLAASARFDQEHIASDPDTPAYLSGGSRQQAAEMESQLLQDPENLEMRGALMAFYSNEGNEAAFTRQLLWVINHHPEAQIAGLRIYDPPDTPTAQRDHELAKAAWERALSKYPNSPDVLFHAGMFIERDDPKRALDLFKRAKDLTAADSPVQEQYLHAISIVYASAVITDLKRGDPPTRINEIPMDQNLAGALHTEIENSSDPELLTQVGTRLAESGEYEQGLSLIRRAIDLDPGNPKWKEALDSANAEPVRRQNMRDHITGKAAHPIRIAPDVAKANLITKVQPVYPPLALQARVTGIVEFRVDIGADGKVQSLLLMRGHPLLVNAAKDALLQWVFRPTLLNGNPVPVTTTIEVPFTLPQ